MNPQCAKCKRSHSTRDETLLTCCYCSMSWHNVCHVPRVSNLELLDLIYLNRHEEKIDFTRCGWSCSNCKALIKTSSPEQSTSSLKGPANTRENSHLLSSSGSDRSQWPKQTARKGATRDQWRIDWDESSDYDDIETMDPLLGRTKQTARKSTTSDLWYTDDELSDGDEIDTLDFASNLIKKTAITPRSTNEPHGISGRGGIESSSKLKQPSPSTSSRPKQTARKGSTSDPWYTEDDAEFSGMAEIEAIAFSSRYDYPRSPAASNFDSYDALFALTKAFELQSISPNPSRSDHAPGRKRQTARKASTSVRSSHSWSPTSVSTQNNSLPMDASVRDQRTIQKGPVQNRNHGVSGDRAGTQALDRPGSLPLHHGPPVQMDSPHSSPSWNNSSRDFGHFFSDMSGHARAPSGKKQTARKGTNYDSGPAKNRNTVAQVHTISSPHMMPVQAIGNAGARDPWSSDYYNTTIEAQTINSPSTRSIQTARKTTTSNPWLKNTSIASQPRTSAPFTAARTGWASAQKPSMTEAKTREIRNIVNPAHITNDNHDGSIAWWVNAREMATSSTNNSGSHASGPRKKGGRKKGQARHIGGQEMGNSGFTFVSRNWASERT